MINPQWFSELRRLWPNVPWQVTCKLLSKQVPTLCLDSGIVTPLRLCWVKGVFVFRWNLPPALLVEWLRSFTCHSGNMGVEQTPKKESAHKVNSGEENSPITPAGIGKFCKLYKGIIHGQTDGQIVSSIKGLISTSRWDRQKIWRDYIWTNKWTDCIQYEGTQTHQQTGEQADLRLRPELLNDRFDAADHFISHARFLRPRGHVVKEILYLMVKPAHMIKSTVNMPCSLWDVWKKTHTLILQWQASSSAASTRKSAH